MATGWQMQVAKQTGEYLVSAELNRRSYICATFSGNVPYYDIVAASQKGVQTAIQVKAIRKGAWQFDARHFVRIDFEPEAGKKCRKDSNSDDTCVRQILGERQPQPYPGLVCVFVLLGPAYGKDRFFVFPWRQLQDWIVDGYSRWLKQHSGFRPQNCRSVHTSVRLEELARSEGKWDIIKNSLPKET